MKNTLFLLAATVILFFSPNINASILKKKASVKTTVQEPSKKQPTAYEKLFKGKTESAKSSFITQHKTDGKLYFEFPLKYLNRKMLLASTLSEISAGHADIGYKSSQPLYIKFAITDSIISMYLVNATTVSDDANINKALQRETIDPILFSYPIKAYNPDSSAVVFDVTSLFTTDVKQFSFLSESNGILKVNVSFKKENSFLDSFKSFEDNLTVKSTLSYSLSSNLMGQKILDEQPVTAKVTRSILLLPEKKMIPRISDSRVGIFNHDIRKYSITKDEAETYSLAHRWRIEPKDVEAYKRGEMVEPVKPVVFYIDDAFPELWKEPVKESVEKWNAAFEKIGFKNVMIARSFPTQEEDPDFDPDNLKYSCIRYLPSTTANAKGPSWVDPATGEIINASVLVYSNIIQLINNWRFVQTAQIDPRVRTKKMPDDIIKESISYIVAHEVGHCLGFMHNMAASSSFPVDSLRSASFTKINGTTPCIMDYARFNYVAQPEDKGVRLTPPDLGIYDYFLVKWNYTCLPDETSEWDKHDVIESWVDEHAGDPVYRYGRQQTAARYDPSSNEEDLGDNPVKASDYGIKNLKYILSNLEKWITDDSDYSHRQGLYTQIQSQYSRYITNVMYNIGGIYITEVKEGTSGKRYVPVPKETQKQSLKWILNEYRNMDWIDNQFIKEHTNMQIKGKSVLREGVLRDIKGLIHYVVLSTYYSDTPYSIEEFTNDLYNASWEALLQNKKLNDSDKALQRAMVDLFCDPFVEKQGMPAGVSFHEENPLIDEYDRDFGTPGYGYQGRVSVSTIDDSKIYLQNLAIKSRNLLKSRINQVSGLDKIHYQSLLIKLNTVLKDKI